MFVANVEQFEAKLVEGQRTQPLERQAVARGIRHRDVRDVHPKVLLGEQLNGRIVPVVVTDPAYFTCGKPLIHVNLPGVPPPAPAQ